MSQKFYNILVSISLPDVYHVTKADQVVVGTHYGCSILVVGSLTRCVLLHSMCNLKAAQMNMECNLICELKLYEFRMGSNAAEATKNICCVKGEGNHSTVIKLSKKF